MSYVLKLSPAIEGDIVAAVNHYREIEPELAGRFVDEFERTLRLIAAHPQAGRILYGDVRRMVLAHFPYLITYRLAEDEIRVQLVVHVRRDPVWIQEVSSDRL